MKGYHLSRKKKEIKKSSKDNSKNKMKVRKLD